MAWSVLSPNLKPIEHLCMRFKDGLANTRQGRQLQLNSAHPSWEFGLVFLWHVSLNVQEMHCAVINVNVGHRQYWLSFLISCNSVMYCWQKFPKKAFPKLVMFRNLLEMTFRYLFSKLLCLFIFLIVKKQNVLNYLIKIKAIANRNLLSKHLIIIGH
jgi:hypothetical protein